MEQTNSMFKFDGKQLRYLVLMLTAILFAALLTLDTRHYRTLLSELPLTESSIYAINEQIAKDLEQALGCKQRYQDANTLRIDPAIRECITSASKGVSTYAGALAVSATAEAYLIDNPQDDEIRQIGVDAIRRGLAWLIEHEKPIDDARAAVAKASNESISFRFINGHQPEDSLFIQKVKYLHDQEMALLNPAVAQAQRQWLIDALKESK